MNKTWKNYRIKDIAKVSRGASPRPIQDYLTNDKVNGIPWVKISDATKVKKNIESTEQYIILSGVGKSNLVLPGDLIVSNSATPGVPRFLKIKACIHDGWLLLRKFKNVNKEFLFYLIESIRLQLKNQGTGSIFINLSIEILANEIVSIPSIEKQIAIANYLDIETDKIDKKISILEQKIEKLEEYKQSVIFETVTKGLDKNVEMKDSGIEWIGQIPKDWEVKRVKEYYKLGMGQTILKEDLEEGGKYPVYSATAEDKFFGFINKISNPLNKNDLVIPARGNSIGFVKLVKNICACTQTTIYLKRKLKINSNYIYYYLVGNKKNIFFFEENAIPQITVEQISNKLMLIPNEKEQVEISGFLDCFTFKIENKVELIKKQIELLKEYKEAIIYEAVTGKMEIL